MGRCEKCRQALNSERLANERQKEILKLRMILKNISDSNSMEAVEAILDENVVLLNFSAGES